MKKQKIIVILGPTSSGKSEVAVQLAKKFNGEVISADSRQVYKGLDIGTGKITKKEMTGIPHHLLSFVSPKKSFSVSEWRNKAKKIIDDIFPRGKLPIICGGTAFYIRAIVDNIDLPAVPPDLKLRKNLEKKSARQLFSILIKLDPRRAKTIDAKNPARLIRAIEIAKNLGYVPIFKKQKSAYNVLQIGLNLPEGGLKKNISLRLSSRLKKGMVKETEGLHASGLSWKRLSDLGLEYKACTLFLQGKISKEEMREMILSESWQYVRRQMQWWKGDVRIQWFRPEDLKRMEKAVKMFLVD